MYEETNPMPDLTYPGLPIGNISLPDIEDLDFEIPLINQFKIQYQKSHSIFFIYRQILETLSAIINHYLTVQNEFKKNQSIENLELVTFLDLTKRKSTDTNHYISWATNKRLSAATLCGWSQNPNIYAKNQRSAGVDLSYQGMRLSGPGKKSYIKNSTDAPQYILELHWFECLIGFLKVTKAEYSIAEETQCRKKLINILKNLNVAIQNKINRGNANIYSDSFYLENLKKCIKNQKYSKIMAQQGISEHINLYRCAAYMSEIVDKLKYARNRPINVINKLVERIYGDIFYHCANSAALGQFDIAEYLCKNAFIMLHHPRYLNITLKMLSQYNISRVVHHFNYLISKIAISEVDMTAGRRAIMARINNVPVKTLKPTLELAHLKYATLTRYFYRLNQVLPTSMANNMEIIKYFDNWINLINKSPEDLKGWRTIRVKDQKYAVMLNTYLSNAKDNAIKIYVTGKSKNDQLKRIRVYIPEKVSTPNLQGVNRTIIKMINQMPENSRFNRLKEKIRKSGYGYMPSCTYGINQRLKLISPYPMWRTQYFFQGPINLDSYLEAYLIDSIISKLVMSRYGLIKSKTGDTQDLRAICRNLKYRHNRVEKYVIEKKITKNYRHIEKLFSSKFKEIPKLLREYNIKLKNTVLKLDVINNRRDVSKYLPLHKSNWFGIKNPQLKDRNHAEYAEVYRAIIQIYRIINHINKITAIVSDLERIDAKYPTRSLRFVAYFVNLRNTIKFFLKWYRLQSIKTVLRPLDPIKYKYRPDFRSNLKTLLILSNKYSKYIESEYFEKLLIGLIYFNISEQLCDTAGKIVELGLENSLKKIDGGSKSIDSIILNLYFDSNDCFARELNIPDIAKKTKLEYEKILSNWQVEQLENRNNEIVKHIIREADKYSEINKEAIEKFKKDYLFINIG